MSLYQVQKLIYQRDAVQHGPVREGVCAATGYEGVEAHDARLRPSGSNADASGLLRRL